MRSATNSKSSCTRRTSTLARKSGSLRSAFTPVSAVIVSKEWQATEVVARQLAHAVEGVAFSMTLGKIVFDASGRPTRHVSRKSLESHLAAVFARACRAFDKAERARRSELEAQFKKQLPDPKANDWQDV
jgi:hypothetical protein